MTDSAQEMDQFAKRVQSTNGNFKQGSKQIGNQAFSVPMQNKYLRNSTSVENSLAADNHWNPTLEMKQDINITLWIFRV